jgi:hypothetical protein
MSKPRKTAAELKLMIEQKLRAGHPECETICVARNAAECSSTACAIGWTRGALTASKSKRDFVTRTLGWREGCAESNTVANASSSSWSSSRSVGL